MEPVTHGEEPPAVPGATLFPVVGVGLTRQGRERIFAGSNLTLRRTRLGFGVVVRAGRARLEARRTASRAADRDKASRLTRPGAQNRWKEGHK